jgi:hypothetical protein
MTRRLRDITLCRPACLPPTDRSIELGSAVAQALNAQSDSIQGARVRIRRACGIRTPEMLNALIEGKVHPTIASWQVSILLTELGLDPADWVDVLEWVEKGGEA